MISTNKGGSGDSDYDLLLGEIVKDMLGYARVKLAEQKNDWYRKNLVRTMVRNRNHFAGYSVERYFQKTIVFFLQEAQSS